jgi:hypothetical protein
MRENINEDKFVGQSLAGILETTREISCQNKAS